MRNCIACSLEKPVEDYYKRGDGRLYSQCKVCFNSKRKNRYATEKSYRDKVAANNTTNYKNNRDSILSSNRRWRDSNIERVRQYSRDWRANNPEQRSIQESRRRSLKLSAIPKWTVEEEFNELFMEEAYNLARLRSKVTGFAWHVDHRVPLKSKVVCGLHYHTNLQVIPASENCRKNNLHWENMPCL